MKKSVLFLLMIVILFLSLHTQNDYINIRIKQKYINIIIKDPFLMDGNIGIYHFNKKKYLISVGKTEIKGNNPNAKLNARTIAEVIAHKQMVDLINGVRIDSKTFIEKRSIKSKSMKKTNGIATVKTIKEIKKNIESIIIQRSTGTLPGTEIAGYWTNKTNTMLYIAIVYEINE